MRSNANGNFRLWVAALALSLTVLTVHAESSAADVSEIEFLLHSIGSSGCTFERNGSVHTAPRAEEHLRMKYRKAREYVASADDFIDKLASESSWTGKPYLIRCADTVEPSRRWLTNKLAELRGSD